MGILGSIAGKAAVAAGKAVVKAGAKSAIGHGVEKSRDKIFQQLIDSEPDIHHLLIDQMNSSWVDGFEIYDVHEHAEYFVKEEDSKVILYDLYRNTIGEAKKIHKNNSIEESAMTEFRFSLLGKNVGIMSSQLVKKKKKYKIGFRDWRVVDDLIGTKFAIVDKRLKTIAKISGRGLTWKYDIISFPNPKDRLLALLVVLAIYSDKTN